MVTHLSPKKLASAVGVSESSLKRWADEGRLRVHRTAGGHRRIELAEAVRYIREAGLPVVDPRPLGLAESAEASPDRTLRSPSTETADPASQDAALVRAIADGDAGRARSLVAAMYLAGRPVAEICDQPLATALREVGCLHLHDPDGIHIEHRASDACLQVLHELRRLIPQPPADAPLALGGCPERNYHMMPSLMVAVALASEGWRTVNLGASLPIDTLCRAMRLHRPSLVWLSLSMPEDRPTPRQMQPLLRQLEADRARLMVGGRAARGWRIKHPAIVSSLHSTAELAAYLRGLRRSS